MLRSIQSTETESVSTLSIAIIGPDQARREAVATALGGCENGVLRSPEKFRAPVDAQQISSYPSELVDAPQMLSKQYDVVFIDLDSDIEYALDVVQSIASVRSLTVMVYSAQADRDLVIRCMRAGAREFLTLPLVPDDLSDALDRVSFRLPVQRNSRNEGKRMFVFLGAKGGCGVTTIASGFATSLAQDSGMSTLLIDLGHPLGDAALMLGMLCDYSTLNALEEWNRLDGSFLHSLLARHSSGLFVLAAPLDFPRARPSREAIDKLLAVARQNFHYVVVDIGSRVDLQNSPLFDQSESLYLVTQVGISEMRNANRLITQFLSSYSDKLQIVLNRYVPHTLGLDDDQVAKALTRQTQWKVPDQSASGKGGQRTINDFALEESATTKAMRHMARAACGLPVLEEKKRVFSILGRG